jgi:hypothetical protein
MEHQLSLARGLAELIQQRQFKTVIFCSEAPTGPA